MHYLFWNLSRFGHSGRPTQLRGYICREQIDVVALQETIESDFNFHDVLALDSMQRFDWCLMASVGHSERIDLETLPRSVLRSMLYPMGRFLARLPGQSQPMPCLHNRREAFGLTYAPSI